MEIWYVFASIVLLVLLISWGKIQPFLAFLVASSVAAILLGLPVDKVPGVLEKGVGNILGGLLGIVCIGASDVLTFTAWPSRYGLFSQSATRPKGKAPKRRFFRRADALPRFRCYQQCR